MASAQDTVPAAGHIADMNRSVWDMDAAAHLPDMFPAVVEADIPDRMVDKLVPAVAGMTADKVPVADMAAGNIAAAEVADNCRPLFLVLQIFLGE